MTDIVLKCYVSFIHASICAACRVIGFVFLEQIQGLCMHLHCIVCLTTTESCYLIVVHINCQHIHKVLGMIIFFCCISNKSAALMFDHQRALLSLSPSLVLFCVSLGSVCIRKTISSHKRASLPLFNAVCVSVRESKLCCLNADVLCCSSGPLIQVTSHKSVSSSSFITHFPSCRPPLPLSLFL